MIKQLENTNEIGKNETRKTTKIIEGLSLKKIKKQKKHDVAGKNTRKS